MPQSIPATTAPAYRFLAWELNTALRELRRNGNIVPLEPKSFSLLLYLLENRDRAVSKDELQDAIWPDTIVAESSLTRCVMKVRRALDDDAEHPGAIATVRGHGYRFVADVVATKDHSGKTLPATLNKPTVAVLPFQSLSDESEQTYLADGMSDDIITLLSAIPGSTSLRAIPPTLTKENPQTLAG